MAIDRLDSTERSLEWRISLARQFGGVRAEQWHYGARVPVSGILVGVELGHARAYRAMGTPQIVRRSKAAIVDADSDPYKVCLLTRGRATLRQGDTVAQLRPGELAMYDTGRPYEIRFDGEFGCSVLSIDRAELPASASAVNLALAHSWGPDEVAVALLRNLIKGVTVNAPGPRLGAGHEHLGDAAIQLVASLVRGNNTETPDSIRRRQIVGFIRAHLADPELNHDAIAAAHGLSSRTLHRLFEDEARTVTQVVRDMRLDAIKSTLADPAMEGRATAAIAATWGYVNPSRFSRAFTSRFGITPGAFRRHAHRGDLRS